MFDVKVLENINPQYFNIIMLSEYDVTIQSKNTGHYWYLHNTDYPAEGNCVIFHKHKAFHPYHLHGRADTLPQAVRSIKKHDKWWMGGRKRCDFSSENKKNIDKIAAMW